MNLSNQENPTFPNEQLILAFPISLEIIKKKFPISVEIQETECNSMMIGNIDRLLFKSKYYNHYCFIEIVIKTYELRLTIFKSDHKNFEKIESDFLTGFCFATKDKKDVNAIINSLV